MMILQQGGSSLAGLESVPLSRNPCDTGDSEWSGAGFGSGWGSRELVRVQGGGCDSPTMPESSPAFTGTAWHMGLRPWGGDRGDTHC